MEAVARPDWAAPLVVGVHVREFRSALPEEETRQIVGVLRDDPELVAFLARHPLGRLELSDDLPDKSWRASYDLAVADLIVDIGRPSDSYGYEFVPSELPTVSAAASTLIEALQRSLYHELGHHLLHQLGPQAEIEIATLMRTRRAFPVSRRARRDPSEYFAETFTAYRFENTLADRDPEGYDIVEALLRQAWRL